jgi:hypothetical protein
MLGWLQNRVREAPQGEVTRDLRGDGWHVQLDLSPQVLSLAIPEGEGTWPKGGEEELAPTCSGLADGFVSASMLAVKAKLFDLEADPASKAAYSAHLDFVAQLTNPLVSDMPDLRKPNGRWFFPPSQSLESALVKRLYGDRFIPDGWSLADEIVKRLRDGSSNIDPTDTSGWYDLQTWALEPLVRLDEMPEGARLTIDDRYREQLEDVFKAIFALTRETHVKQLQFLRAGSALRAREVVVRIAPDLTVEPIRTYYERRALGYQFVRHILDSVCSLKSIHRLTDASPVMRPLDEELEEMTALMLGAATTVGEELGMAAAAEPEAGRFRAWAKHPDIAEDVRMMVPVFFDRGRSMTKVWAILGWATRLLRVSYVAPPSVRVLEGAPRVEFGAAGRRIAYPVFAEVYVSRLLDRDEFRTHCDRYKTRGSILQHL